MELVPEIAAGRRTLGICVMTIVPVLQLVTEYLGTGDRRRAISKLAVTVIGLPILIQGSSAGLRWAAGRRSGPLVLLVSGMLFAGTLYAVLLYAVYRADSFLVTSPPLPGAAIAGSGVASTADWRSSTRSRSRMSSARWSRNSSRISRSSGTRAFARSRS